MKTFFDKILILFLSYITIDNLITVICYGDLTFKDMTLSEIRTYVVSLLAFLFFGYFLITLFIDLIKDNKE